MRAPRDYDDIPGTYVFDGSRSQAGYHLNMFCMSLNKEANRAEFRRDETSYLGKFPMTPEQRQAVLDREWLRLLQLGGNMYYTFKLAIFDSLGMQDVGGIMSGLSTEEFSDMLIAGGRPIEGNRTIREAS
ncbi:MAG: protocatechuate 4,5-dioxygenase subunit alpha [Actinomycetota bacterium]|nr:protocatechuate 4,5-dioxygenase subunit alpha [Actinomycetota bacterium]